MRCESALDHGGRAGVVGGIGGGRGSVVHEDGGAPELVVESVVFVEAPAPATLKEGTTQSTEGRKGRGCGVDEVRGEGAGREGGKVGMWELDSPRRM